MALNQANPPAILLLVSRPEMGRINASHSTLILPASEAA